MTPVDSQLLRQLGKKLSHPKSYLREMSDSQFGLFKRGQKTEKPQMLVAVRHVVAWQKADLVNGVIDLTLSANGRSFLNRAAGGYLAQHRLVVPGTHTTPAISHATPLRWLRARKQDDRFGLLEHEFEAGEKLASDYARATLVPRLTMDWRRPVFVDEGTRTGETPVGLATLEARRRVQAALDYTGPGLSDLALAVCCAEVGLEECERGFALPKRSGKVMLKMALMRLSVHYGYQSVDKAAASFRIR
jgi:hypothetical protein